MLVSQIKPRQRKQTEVKAKKQIHKASGKQQMKNKYKQGHGRDENFVILEPATATQENAQEQRKHRGIQEHRA
jgi:hypothetical protein